MGSQDQHVETILEKIREARNFDFRNYKRATLGRRIDRRMADRGIKSYADYLAFLDREPHEYDSLISSMLIKVTAFFRDSELWDELGQKILPALLAGTRPTEEIRVWCAGCATGEEAFSIAILIAEALGAAFANTEVKVFGTDVDEAAISAARRAVYSEAQVEAVPPALLARYFTRGPDGFAVKQEIRRMVVFGVNNLVSDAPIGRLDLLICRNVFIYLDAALQKRVLSRFNYAMSPGGVLILGRAELLPFATKMFEQVDIRLRIYRKDGQRELAPSAPERLAAFIEPEVVARPSGPSRDESTLASFYREVIDATNFAVIVTTPDGTVTLWNSAAARLWSRSESDVLGKRLPSLALSGMAAIDIAEKAALVHDGKRERETADTASFTHGTYAVDIRAIRDSARELVSLLYVAYDVTALRSLETEMRRVTEELSTSNQQLVSSNEQLRASNEELETTNEELQSANEELQTTNEELHSTNEELETTNEELQSANAELDTINRELAHRTEEMHLLGLYQRTIIRSLSAAIVVVDNAGRIGSWNLAAERLLGLPEAEAVGQTVWTLRIPAISRQLMQRVRRALGERRALRDENVTYELPTGGQGHATLAALPLLDGERGLGAILLFEDITRSVGLSKENHKLKESLKAKMAKPTPDGDGRRTRRGE